MASKKSKRAHKPQKRVPHSHPSMPTHEPPSALRFPGRSGVRRLLSNRVTFLDRFFGQNVDDWHIWLTLLTTGLLCAGLLSGEQWVVSTGSVLALKRMTKTEQ